MASSDIARGRTPRGMDVETQQALGPAVRLLCHLRLVVLAFALVLAVLGGTGPTGVFLVTLAAPFSFVPALNWDTRGRVYARNGILLAADIVVTLVALVPLAGSPLMTVYTAATGALWGLFAGLRLSVVMTVPLCLFQMTAYEPSWRGVVTGVAGATLTVLLAWVGTQLGTRLRQEARNAAALAAVREEQAALTERLRLARDLHDTVAGDLAGLALTTHGLVDRLEREGTRTGTVELSRRLADAVRTAHRHTRSAIGELRDDAQGITGPLVEMVHRWGERTGIAVHVTTGATVDDVAGHRRARHVRAIVTELLENVRKHAHASRVEIDVVADGPAVDVRVSDDGRGLPGDRTRPDSYGMRGIRERAAICAGEARWEAAPDGGTVVRVRLPAEPGGQADDAPAPGGSADVVPGRRPSTAGIVLGGTAEVA